MILSNDQIEFYNNEGYVLVEDVISEDQLNAMLKIVDDFFEKSKAIKENDNIFDLEEGHSANNPRLKRLSNLINIHHFFGIF